MRGRPKVVLARTYDEAWSIYQKYPNNTLGVISDCRFPRHEPDRSQGCGLAAEKDPEAGFRLLKAIRDNDEYIPMIMQSSESKNRERAERNRILELLLHYYRLHLPEFPELRSVQVLQELFE
jgi:hypothetical protein